MKRAKMDFQPIVRAYDRFLNKDSGDARLVAWRNAKSQERKFAEITRILNGDATPFTVYDVGCGLANLHDFHRLIERARRRHPDISLECRDILRSPPRAKYDYALASGTFNLRLKIRKDRWDAYVRSMLLTFYRIARRGVAVDFLSSFANNKGATEYHPKPVSSPGVRTAAAVAARRDTAFPITGHFALLVYRSARVLASLPRE